MKTSTKHVTITYGTYISTCSTNNIKKTQGGNSTPLGKNQSEKNSMKFNDSYIEKEQSLTEHLNNFLPDAANHFENHMPPSITKF